MINKLKLAAFALFLGVTGTAQEVEFVQYTLDNGLDVILHQDNTAPVVTTSVMYHVGAKDENPERTGFAHFFEHLLFEGTENIGKGEWFKIVSSNGGSNNANTSDDRTYYYEIFPSNQLELGLWMESERMLHPVIDQQGVDTQNEVVKEEKRLRIDNAPYGNILTAVKQNLFTKHPYRWSPIGSMEHLDAATLEEFRAFNEKFYVPNNATLVVAGDIEIEKTKELIEAYFSDIPKGAPVEKEKFVEEPITETLHATYHDPNIQIPAIALAWRTPSMKERDAYVLDMVSSVLSDGKSSRLYKKLVDDQKQALQIGAFNLAQEDYGQYVIFGLPLGETSLDTLVAEVDEEITKLQTELISQREFEKLQNKFENRYVNSNSSVAGIASSLATYQQLYGNTDLINEEIDIYRSITREEIRDVAKKYLNPNQRLELEYLPKQETEQ
ncbi:Predicted Zn-dependent peptidase [Salinimicrobium sediminis]|uniref:Predicted Zn-dependent peptidase n=1 Tax=Salinimicrobium sediminis TaxID=1343891 RepID=A0A285X152_9FLAO|nr:pitrilysin family protein [Salinimicrobium sediminis]MDX1753358.1 pitrilysin family protein [Salinimicrobium sediminis]SOC79067.1 Predicted Zn-dependent peptidase [Salinimicrobium sediminis]